MVVRAAQMLLHQVRDTVRVEEAPSDDGLLTERAFELSSELVPKPMGHRRGKSSFGTVDQLGRQVVAEQASNDVLLVPASNSHLERQGERKLEHTTVEEG